MLAAMQPRNLFSGRQKGPPGPGPGPPPPASWPAPGPYDQFQYQQEQHAPPYDPYWQNSQNGAYCAYWEGRRGSCYNPQQCAGWSPQSPYPYPLHQQAYYHYYYGGGPQDYSCTPASSEKRPHWLGNCDYFPSAEDGWRDPHTPRPPDWREPFQEATPSSSPWSSDGGSSGGGWSAPRPGPGLRSNLRSVVEAPRAPAPASCGPRPPPYSPRRPPPPPTQPCPPTPPQPCPPPMCPPPYSPPQPPLCPPCSPSAPSTSLPSVPSWSLPSSGEGESAQPAAQPPAVTATENRASDSTDPDALKRLSKYVVARYHLASPQSDEESQGKVKKSRWDVTTPSASFKPKKTHSLRLSEDSEKSNACKGITKLILGDEGSSSASRTGQTDAPLPKLKKKACSDFNVTLDSGASNACGGISQPECINSLLVMELSNCGGKRNSVNEDCARKEDKPVKGVASASKPEKKTSSGEKLSDLGKSIACGGITLISEEKESSVASTLKKRDSSSSKAEKKELSDKNLTVGHSGKSESSCSSRLKPSESNPSPSLPSTNEVSLGPIPNQNQCEVIASTSVDKINVLVASKSVKSGKHLDKIETGLSSKSNSSQNCVESKDKPNKANHIPKESNSSVRVETCAILSTSSKVKHKKHKKDKKEKREKEMKEKGKEMKGKKKEKGKEREKEKEKEKVRRDSERLFSPDLPKNKKSGTARSVGAREKLDSPQRESRKNEKKAVSVFYPPKFKTDFRIPKKNNEALPNPFTNTANDNVCDNVSKPDTWLQKGTTKNNIPSSSALSTKIAPIAPLSLRRSSDEDFWSIEKSSKQNCEVQDILEGRMEIDLAEEILVAKRKTRSVTSTPKSSKRKKADSDDEWTPTRARSGGRRSRCSSISSKPPSPARSGIASRTRSRTRSPSRHAPNPLGFSGRYSTDEESEEETTECGSNWTDEGIEKWLRNASSPVADHASIAACKTRLVDIAHKKKIFNQDTQNYVSVDKISLLKGQVDVPVLPEGVETILSSSNEKILSSSDRIPSSPNDETPSLTVPRISSPSQERNLPPSSEKNPQPSDVNPLQCSEITPLTTQLPVPLAKVTEPVPTARAANVAVACEVTETVGEKEDVVILDEDNCQSDIEEIDLEGSLGPVNTSRPWEELWRCMKVKDKYYFDLLEDNLKLAIDFLSTFIQKINEAEKLKTKTRQVERFGKLRQEFVENVKLYWSDTKASLDNICKNFSNRDLYEILKKKLSATNDLSDPQSFVKDLEELFLLVTTPSMKQLKCHCGDTVTLAARLFLLYKTKEEYLNEISSIKSNVQVDVAQPEVNAGVVDEIQAPATVHNPMEPHLSDQEVAMKNATYVCKVCPAAAEIRCSSCSDIFYCSKTCQVRQKPIVQITGERQCLGIIDAN
ncbi:Non-homologous end joining protein Ku [Frankliniella fusca]|uniref:Non-homologous end joining protein Ku n=1 Tax=Frankliniella fusca TaxID=407009 RepID=A0AAE1HDP6_9NEOP|nr:Non-homologous end joining protein Ku [Frankliniella fusca]